MTATVAGCAAFLRFIPGMAGVASHRAGKSALRGLTFAMAELVADGIHVAMVTVAGSVAPGTAFDPDHIARHYLDLHQQAAGAWETERHFDGR
ncbi:hypothetical protein [Pararhizobium sp. PWRC1-1]|uniref:hypothetical protein n=1 Tax=Pararhizobium sp. PWRC1-1 TaxID=2804566 RepID=UPI003CF47F58